MNDTELISALIGLLPQCRQRCGRPATKWAPTGEVGYHTFWCDDHAAPGFDNALEGVGPHDVSCAPTIRLAEARVRRTT